MDQLNAYITEDVHGVRRIAGTRISIDSVVLGFQRGESPEEIQRNFPALNLEQVYGTITHYLANRQEIETYLRKQQTLWAELRARNEANPNAAVERLRKLRSTKAEQVG